MIFLFNGINPDHIVAWCTAIAGVLALISTLAGFIASNTKNKKAKRIAEKAATLAKQGEYLCSKTANLVQAAEHNKTWTGEQKKQWVLTSLEADLLKRGYSIDLEEISMSIENAVSLLNTNKELKKA